MKKDLILIEKLINSGLDFSNSIEIPDDKNPLPAMYLQSIIIKTTSLLQSIGSLVYIGQISDAQILMRVLVEIKINLDYLFILVKKEGDKAFLRVFISETVHKNKLVNSVDWGKDYKKIFKNWDINIAELKNLFSKDEYKKIKNNGFYDCNLEERAKLTKNSKWYNNAYRQYSQNIHNLDIHEILAQKNNDHFYLFSRKKALLAMLPLCASSIFITCSKIKKLTNI